MAAKSNVPTQTKEAVKRQDKKQTGQRFSELIGDASNVRDASTRMLLLDQDRTVPIVETSKTVRGPQPIPNIPDLTARGGLQPSEGVPFRLGAIGDELTMDVHGCNTVSVRRFERYGFEKDILAARQICIHHPEARDPRFIGERYGESFGFMEPEWIQRRIVDERDTADCATALIEVDDKLRTYPTIGRVLEPYPTREHSLAAGTLVGNRGRGRPRSEIVTNIREVIQRISATGVRGERYCREMDRRGLSTPIDWQKREGCPRSYLEAWNFRDTSKRQKFRRLITHHKYKMSKSPQLA